jgi:dihydroneopterin aldolase
MTANGRIASPAMRHVFVRDMVLSASIGIYPHEHATAQRVRVNVDCGVADDAAAGVGRDELPRVVSYERIAQDVRRIVGAGHVKLVETLAERIAEACLADDRVSLVRVRVEKLDVFTDAASAGVEIERHAATCPLRVVDS